MDHYNNPLNIGNLDDNKRSVGTGMVEARECGDVVKLQIEVDEGHIIKDAKFKTFCCGSAVASSSAATEWLKGKSLDEALLFDEKQVNKDLEIPRVKQHCSILTKGAIKAAINDYRTKNGLEVF